MTMLCLVKNGECLLRAFCGGLFLANLFGIAPLCNGGRPLIVDDAEPVAKGKFELEAGVEYTKQASIHHVDVPLGLTYGLTRSIEFSVGAGGQFEETRHALEKTKASGVKDFTVFGKWKFLDQQQSWASFALAGGLKVPTADVDRELGTGGYDYSLTLISTRSFGATSIDLNAGYTWTEAPIFEDVRYIMLYGAAVRHELGKSLQLVGEVFAVTPVSDHSAAVLQTSGGAQYEVVRNLVLDVAVGTGFRAGSLDFIAKAGLTWSF